MTRAYVGTVDYDPDHSFDRELQIWRSVDHADDEASRLHIEGSEPVSVCLIGREFDVPLLYEVATEPTNKQSGLGSAILRQAMCALHGRSEGGLLAWVTDGNYACERMLSATGFVAATAGLGPTEARALYADIATAKPVDLPAWLLSRPT